MQHDSSLSPVIIRIGSNNLTAPFLLQLLQYDFSLSPVIIRMMQLTAVSWVSWVGLDATPAALLRPQLVAVTAAERLRRGCS